MVVWQHGQPSGQQPVTSTESTDGCPICRRGRLTTQVEKLDFSQRSDKGPVRCRVSIPVTVCDACGHKAWSSDAETAIQEAVLREYNKLP
jgi:C4-type Zn-finger protein